MRSITQKLFMNCATRICKQYQIDDDDLQEIERVEQSVRQKIANIEEEAGIPISELRETYLAITRGERRAEQAKAEVLNFALSKTEI